MKFTKFLSSFLCFTIIFAAGQAIAISASAYYEENEYDTVPVYEDDECTPIYPMYFDNFGDDYGPDFNVEN